MPPEEATLLRTVLEQPGDARARLAYAGYMDQIGDPRGRFIRTQLALARIGLNPEDARWFPLASESDALIKAHGVRWAEPVAPLVSGYEFERGFVGAVTMTARQFLERAPQLFSAAPVQHLNLTAVREAAAELFTSPYLLHIRSLDLQQNGLRDAEAITLAASPYVRELRWLSLMLNDIGAAGIEALAASKNLANLKYAELSGNRINPGQRFEIDQGIVVDSWLPDEALRLEERYGPLPWLRAEAETAYDIPPDRFRLSLT